MGDRNEQTEQSNMPGLIRQDNPLKTGKQINEIVTNKNKKSKNPKNTEVFRSVINLEGDLRNRKTIQPENQTIRISEGQISFSMTL